MLLVDKCRKGRFGTIVKFATGFFAAGVLSGGNDFEVFVSEVFINSLPPGQVEAASSPRGPGEDQHFLAVEIREFDLLSFAIGQFKVGSDTVWQQPAAEHGDLAKAPN